MPILPINMPLLLLLGAGSMRAQHETLQVLPVVKTTGGMLTVSRSPLMLNAPPPKAYRPATFVMPLLPVGDTSLSVPCIALAEESV